MIFPKRFNGSFMLFDGWDPKAEGRDDVGYEGLLGEVWISGYPDNYICEVHWYKRLWIWRKMEKSEIFFRGRGGGGLKALIRATNLYFKRKDDVEGGLHTTDWDEW